MADYERHEPANSLLHRIVREQLRGFLACASRRDQPVPRVIEYSLLWSVNLEKPSEPRPTA